MQWCNIVYKDQDKKFFVTDTLPEHPRTHRVSHLYIPVQAGSIAVTPTLP